MLALRKAMKLFPIKNAVSFHSSIKQARLNEELQDYISDTYNYDPIDTFTVSGKIPTTKRNDIVQEFAKSDKALITNARCLTEGVDVPNIDCIVFADPRRSKVDIVQALGRALRTKEGKDWGYVILPVIYDDKTNEIDNDNFNEILSVVRGLAANDERIVDYFKFKESERIEKSKAGERIFNFEVFSEYIDESELKDNLQIKLWDKLSRFEWMPFEEARLIVRDLKINSIKEWKLSVSNKQLPYNIPNWPNEVYENKGWINWGDFLGTGMIAPKNRIFMKFFEARKYARNLNLKSHKDWLKFNREGKRPKNLPANPSMTYNEFNGWEDFLGHIRKTSKRTNYLTYNKSKELIRKFKIKSNKEWRIFSKTNKKPKNIPASPQKVYSSEFVSWGDFLGYEPKKRRSEILNFKEAKKVVSKLNLDSQKDYKKQAYLKNQKLPSAPSIYYKDQWKGWDDFLGKEKK